jgi:hypothetical protein
MSYSPNPELTEDELDVLVSMAIRRAERLEAELGTLALSGGALEVASAWAEVLACELQLSEITRPNELSGGIARVGAVRAAISAGMADEASRLAARFLEESGLPEERRQAIHAALAVLDIPRSRRGGVMAVRETPRPYDEDGSGDSSGQEG